MSEHDERRERYKTALRSVRALRDGKNLDRQADAVAAVADAETAELRTELEAIDADRLRMSEECLTHSAEIGRLRAERDELKQKRNGEAYEHGREIGRAVEAEATIGRVRTPGMTATRAAPGAAPA